MAFLFKSKKPQVNGLGLATGNLNSVDGYISPSGTGSPKELDRNRGNDTPTSSINSSFRVASSLSVEGGSARGRNESSTPTPQTLAPMASKHGDVSLYPWSQQRLDFISSQANPFPRYGSAANAVASKDGDIYLIGGLINGSTVKGDLWIVEAGDRALNCYPISTTSEGPGPRVGHASLLIGNAFIVFGGDTKIDENDPLDETLYLLNTSTKQWSRSLPAGPRPSGRYGHTINFLGSKLYIFGGQVEGFFFNDLIAFDLNALQASSNRWEVLLQNTSEGGPPHGQCPPARTNHSVVAWKDKLILFGGTDGIHWFNDVWEYNPRTNAWTMQDCMGFIPIAREGHAAALVDDVMYVFGGRTEEGKDLGDLAAYRLTTRRWYSFQNMGPSPSPRSGHTMTTSGNKIVVLGGEPSSTPRVDFDELSMAYILDTGKIRYPVEDSRVGSGQRHAGGRRSSTERSTSSRDRSSSRDRNDQASQSSFGSQESLQNTLVPRVGVDNPVNGLRMLRAPAPVSAGPPPQKSSQPRMNGRNDYMDGESRQEARPSNDLAHQAISKEHLSAATVSGQSKSDNSGSPQGATTFQTTAFNDLPESPAPNSIRSRTGSMRSRRGQSSVDSTHRDGMVIDDAKSREISRNIQNSQLVDSGLGSSPSMGQRHEDTQELDTLKTQSSWLAAELALARQAGYRPKSEMSFEHGGHDTFGEEDKPLLDGLLSMKEELEKMRQTLGTQTGHAAEQIAQIERQRDTAIAEAVYINAKTAAQNQTDSHVEGADKTLENAARLGAALASQNELSAQLRSMTAELEAERIARQDAEESASIALQRATDLDTYKQQTNSELESLRAELHETHVIARQEAASSAEAVSAHQLIQVDKKELLAKLSASQSQIRDHDSVIASLRDAMSSSSDKASLMERKLEYERRQRSNLEEKLSQLTAEHESRNAELETALRLLQDTEEVAESHANEAKLHREAVLSLTKRNEKDEAEHAARDERVSTLQQRLEAANALVRKNQQAADTASERLRRAEERIAGLETYQEQASREALMMRKQLQAASKDALTLRNRNAEVERQRASEKLDATAVQVQHSALKGLLRERGVDVGASGTLPQDAENQEHLEQLQLQVSTSLRAHDEMRSSFEQQQKEVNQAWEEKLAALDNDYQAAVKYLKGTEKMLSKMKQELHKYKTQNRELEDAVSKKGVTSPDWTQERIQLRTQIENMQTTMNQTQSQLQQQARDVQIAQQERDHYRQQIEQSQSALESMQSQNKSLESRAAEAERKAQFLLSTVGTTVNNYVRDTPRMNGSVYNRDASSDGESPESGLLHPDDTTRSTAIMARNSMALDTLASELETLRSHWETTNKNGRPGGSPGLDSLDNVEAFNGEVILSNSLAKWRKNLEMDDEGEEELPPDGMHNGNLRQQV